MILIGITGKSGAGKTTFSNILSKKKEIGVIHIDDILKKIKLKYFGFIMQKDRQGEKTKVNSKFKLILYGNKSLFNIFMQFRAKLLEKPINNEIKRLEESGKNIIIIDDIFLQYQKCYNQLKEVFLIERSFIDRINSVKERDDVSKKDVVVRDLAHFRENYKDKKSMIKIQNKNSKEDLKDIAEEIYLKYFSDTNIKNKYKENIEEQKISKENIKININNDKSYSR